MRLKKLEIVGFKSFAKKGVMEFSAPISAVVGPNGSGKSNVAEAIRFVLGEQSLKSMRGKKGGDLIFNGSQQAGRLNHARVTITFDNTDRGMNIDFDEVTISREVFRDGSHQYYINGSQVRLKDVIELLSSVHIGASGHHIISQGEADRILNASVKERRIMVEDALGLKVYHWKIEDSEKKLAKTEENIKEIESLRRELAPQLKYLQKQVQKLERARELREELSDLYREYLKREDIFTRKTAERLSLKKQHLESEQEETDAKLTELKSVVESNPIDEQAQRGLTEAEQKLKEVRDRKSDINREIGKVEGVIEYEQSHTKENQQQVEQPVAYETVKRAVDELKWNVGEALSSDDLGHVKGLLQSIHDKMASFMSSITQKTEHPETNESRDGMIADLKKKRGELKEQLNTLASTEEQHLNRIRDIEETIESKSSKQRHAERALYQAQSVRTQNQNQINAVTDKERELARARARYEQEVRSAISFIGERAQEYESFEIDEDSVFDEDRQIQEDRRMKVERIKIRIEDMGGGSGEDIMKEYREIKEHDEFLEKELGDLKKSAQSLRSLIADLSGRLESEFNAGIEKINVEFQNFFALMFGGGSASLSVVIQKRRKKKEEEENVLDDETDESGETGVDIDVNLPRKKVKGLVMLSGGERALTSIALLFAMSQVKPPPFLILDETDAALDEANSRKYGDMLENLSAFSQLIVVTHNRETMGRAGILYGVTMGADAASKLLSIKFEEAVQVAK